MTLLAGDRPTDSPFLESFPYLYLAEMPMYTSAQSTTRVESQRGAASLQDSGISGDLVKSSVTDSRLERVPEALIMPDFMVFLGFPSILLGSLGFGPPRVLGRVLFPPGERRSAPQRAKLPRHFLTPEAKCELDCPRGWTEKGGMDLQEGCGSFGSVSRGVRGVRRGSWYQGRSSPRVPRLHSFGPQKYVTVLQIPFQSRSRTSAGR